MWKCVIKSCLLVKQFLVVEKTELRAQLKRKRKEKVAQVASTNLPNVWSVGIFQLPPPQSGELTMIVGWQQVAPKIEQLMFLQPSCPLQIFIAA